MGSTRQANLRWKECPTPCARKFTHLEPGPFRTDFAGLSLRQSIRAIEDYSATAGLLRKEKSGIHGTQPGDPARAAQCIIRAMENDKPPFRLVLGRLASERVEVELKEQLQELKEWKQTAAEADFPAN